MIPACVWLLGCMVCQDVVSLEIVIPNSKVHGANMGPIWVRQDPGGPHVGPVNFAIWGDYWVITIRPDIEYKWYPTCFCRNYMSLWISWIGYLIWVNLQMSAILRWDEIIWTMIIIWLRYTSRLCIWYQIGLLTLSDSKTLVRYIWYQIGSCAFSDTRHTLRYIFES